MATPIDISERFVASPCTPIISSNYDTCGAITLASIDHLSKADLDALFQNEAGLFRDLDAWFYHSIEMKSCGVVVNTWYDWIMGNADWDGAFTNVYRNAVRPGVRAVKGPGLLQPWIMGRQESPINRDHFAMVNSIRIADYTPATAGAAIGTMTAGPLAATTGGTAVIRVTPRHSAPMDPTYFLAKHEIYLFTKTSGVNQQGNWRVVSAAVDDSLTYIDILVTDAAPEAGGATGQNAQSTTPYFQVATTGASSKTGLIIPGINNVNDFESWCNNRPNLDSKKMVPFWYQSSRRTRCVDSEYICVYQRLLQSGVNRAFAEFQNLDMAERNRQDEMQHQKEFVNSFFFQKAISSNQTLTLWESLQSINTVSEVGLTPGLGGKLQAKRANFIGVKEQLRTCGRIKDLSEQPLNLEEFFQANYDLYRQRKSSGKKVTRIEWHTNAQFRALFHRAMLKWYKELYHDSIRWEASAVGQVTDLGMIYDVYRIMHPVSVEIAIISSDFFDDWYDENNAVGNGVGANMLLALDIGKPGTNGGSIYYAPLAGNRKMYKTAAIEELARLDSTFRCVMETTSIDQTLTSEVGTVVVECPLHSLWIENISLNQPVTTGRDVPYEDLY